MKSSWITILAGVVAAVALASVVIGLASPDGEVGSRDDARPTTSPKPTATATTTATPTPTATPEQEPGPDLAPAAVASTWPGRPEGVRARRGSVDWCPAVRTSRAAPAESVFGRAAVDRAACSAVRFVFEKRYSRLSLPRTSYTAGDLDFVLPALTDATQAAIRPRIAAFVAAPDSVRARDHLGLVLLRGEGTPPGAKHASAGQGRVFYGPAFSTRGYRDRAAWVAPSWSTVAIRLDRAKAEPRISATLHATAAVPVWNTASGRDDMMTVPTRAQLFLRQDGKGWKISGWTIASGPSTYARLSVR